MGAADRARNEGGEEAMERKKEAQKYASNVEPGKPEIVEQASPKDEAQQDGVSDLDHGRIAALAYEIWVARGEPEGTEDEDWYEAERRLRRKDSPENREGEAFDY